MSTNPRIKVAHLQHRGDMHETAAERRSHAEPHAEAWGEETHQGKERRRRGSVVAGMWGIPMTSHPPGKSSPSRLSANTLLRQRYILYDVSPEPLYS